MPQAPPALAGKRQPTHVYSPLRGLTKSDNFQHRIILSPAGKRDEMVSTLQNEGQMVGYTRPAEIPFSAGARIEPMVYYLTRKKKYVPDGQRVPLVVGPGGVY